MKVYLADKVSGVPGSLCVAEIEFTSPARRVRVQTSEGLEALDLHGERPGGVYDAAASLPRIHVPLRVTKSRTGAAKVTIRIEDVAGVAPPDSWEGVIQLERTPKKPVGAAMLAGFLVV